MLFRLSASTTNCRPEMESIPLSDAKPRVLNVGQCDFDHGNIGRLLSEEFGARVDRAATSDEAIRSIQGGGYSLVLVNRVFDVDGAQGLDLIKRMRADEKLADVPVMLVSNFADAQEAAVALGARPGFGKDALTNRQTRARLGSILGCR